MLGFNHSKNVYSDYLVFRKPKLPAKIIHLRRASQENHVRRMKVAYQRKQMQISVDDSMSLTFSNPTRNSSSIQTPFTTANKTSAISEVVNNAYSQKSQRLMSEANRDDFSQKSLLSQDKNAGKLSHLKLKQNSLNIRNGYIKSDTAIDMSSGKASGKYLNKEGNPLHIGIKNEKSGNLRPEDEKLRNLWLSPPKIIENRMNNSSTKTFENVLDDLEFKLFQQKTKKLCNLGTLDRNLQETNQRGHQNHQTETLRTSNLKQNDYKITKTKRSISSKIPISLTRLPSLEKNTTDISCLPRGPFKVASYAKTSTPMIRKEVTNIKQNAFNNISMIQNKTFTAEKEDSLNDYSNDKLVRDFRCLTLDSLSQNDERHIRNNEGASCSNSMSSVSKWLNSIVPNANANGELFKIPPLVSHNKTSSEVMNKTFTAVQTSIPEAKNHPNNPYLKKINEEKICTRESSSDSEKSSSYYDTETGDEQLTQEHKERDKNENKWQEDSDAEISEESLHYDTDVNHGKQQISEMSSKDFYRPQTPYYLRYPRLSGKEMKNPIKTYAGMCLNRTPRRKNRRKSTSKRKKGKRNNLS